MPMTTSNAGTIGAQLRNSSGVRASIQAILQEVRERQAEIAGVQGPVGDLRTNLEDFMKRGDAARGRGCLYPYLGSGFGSGALVELLDGSIKYDMICGIGPNFFGHSDTELMGVALEAAMSDVTMQGYLQQNGDAVAFMETIVKEASRNSDLAHAFLCNSGAMANDNALKIIYQARPGRTRVLAFEHCFMGRSIAMSQLGDSAGNRVGVPITMDVDYVPFYDESVAASEGTQAAIDKSVARLRDHLSRYPAQYATFVMEIVQGEGGFNSAPREYFLALIELCREHDIVVWFDEVQTFGRTFEMFAFDSLQLGEYVQMCTIGKMSQVCAALYTPELNPKPGLLSATFLGSSVALNVGAAIVERLRDGGYYGESGIISRHRQMFDKMCKALVAEHPEWFPSVPGCDEVYGGYGGMMRLSPFGGVKGAINKACRALFDEGVITLYCGHGPFHIRFLPPLGVMRVEEWPNVFEIIERGLSSVADSMV